MKCVNCQKKIDLNWEKCPYCETKIHMEEIIKEDNKKKSTVGIIILFFIVMICALALQNIVLYMAALAILIIGYALNTKSHVIKILIIITIGGYILRYLLAFLFLFFILLTC